ncbi:MAG: hypothetical protein O7D97_07130, partial [Planctomycetota bacterium]|nr:hypothetical protein [Planctomycetota bacterium]
MSTFDGVFACITQTCEKDVTPGASVACGVAGAGTTPNKYARCFDLSVELPNLVGSLEIHSVKWGIEQMEHFAGTVGAIPININVYTDSTGCPPDLLSLTLVASASLTVDDADAGSVFITPVLDAVGGQAIVPAGSTLVVEIEAPLDGTPLEPIEYAFRPRVNS